MADGQSLLGLAQKEFLTMDSNSNNYAHLNSSYLNFWQSASATLKACYLCAELRLGSTLWTDSQMTERLRSKNLGPGFGIRHDFYSDPIPLSIMKSVKAKYGCRFLCVLLCFFVKAMRKVLIELGEEVKGSCDVFTAMNVPGHPGGLENHYGHLMLPVSFDEADTASQINALSSQLERALDQREPVISSKLLDISFGMPSFGERKRVPFPPVVVVNVMGPPVEAKVYGKRILDLGFNMGHCGDLGVLFTSFSYNGMWQMGIGVHESVMQSEVSVKRFIEDRKRKSCRSCRLTCYLTIDY